MWVAVRVVPHPSPLPRAGEGTDRANSVGSPFMATTWLSLLAVSMHIN